MSECEFLSDSENMASLLLHEIVNQAKRGVDVEVILEQGKGEESREKLKAAKEFLYFNGIKVYEDSGEVFTRWNMVIVDDFTSVVGTLVWTNESLEENEEMEFWIESEDFAKALSKRFDSIKLLGKKLINL